MAVELNNQLLLRNTVPCWFEQTSVTCKLYDWPVAGHPALDPDAQQHLHARDVLMKARLTLGEQVMPELKLK